MCRELIFFSPSCSSPWLSLLLRKKLVFCFEAFSVGGSQQNGANSFIYGSLFCCCSLFFGLNCKAQYVSPLCPLYSAALQLYPIASSWLFCAVELYTLVFTDNLEKQQKKKFVGDKDFVDLCTHLSIMPLECLLISWLSLPLAPYILS